MTSTYPWKRVWITGASTGIGFEIVKQLATWGIQIAASARNVESLANIPNVKAYPLDVTDAKAVADTFAQIEKDLGPIDLIIAGAGKYRSVSSLELTLDDYRSTLEVNYMGVINIIAVALPAFRARRAGHLSWIASVAGYVGLPKSAAYGPTKAALNNLAEGLKGEVERHGIKVSVINPGFVRTPMTAQNKFPMPFLMEADEAARRTIAGLARGRFEIAYPKRMAYSLKILKLLPLSLFSAVVRRLVK